MKQNIIEKSKLPNGWIETELGFLGNFINGRAFKPSEWEEKGRPIIRIQNLTKSTSKINRYSGDVEEKFLIREGDILISWSATLGCFIHKGEESVLNQHIFKVEPFIDKQFLFYLVTNTLSELKQKVHGSGMQHITKGKFDSHLVLLPPLNEQKRIVSKVKKLLLELDNAEKLLEKNIPKLEQYKQLILKSAFEGNLTEKWRTKNKVNLESVFKKIESGKKHQNKKLQNIKFNKKEEFFKIPEEWKWVHIGEILKDIQYGTSEKAITTKSTIPVLRMGNIQEGELSFDNLKYYPENWKNFKQYVLEAGDILFNRTNSAELVGKTAVYRTNHPTAVFAGYLIRLKILPDVFIPDLLSYYINSIFGKLYIKSVVTQQVGQANVNGTKLFMMRMPLMSFEEQKEILSQLELSFSLIKNTKSIINSMLSQFDVMRSSILKQAFKGKLVPQNLNDESAKILLEKIKLKK